MPMYEPGGLKVTDKDILGRISQWAEAARQYDAKAKELTALEDEFRTKNLQLILDCKELEENERHLKGMLRADGIDYVTESRWLEDADDIPF